MTRVDLDAVLKLQRDYDNLRYEVRRTFENVIELSRGEREPLLIKLENVFLSELLAKVRSITSKK